MGTNSASSPMIGCARCGLLRECGGLDGQHLIWGCFTHSCTSGACEQNDWTCPCRRDVFVDRWREVGGFPFKQKRALRPVVGAALPLYIPLLQHASRRNRPLGVDVAALPTALVTRTMRGGAYDAEATSRQELRADFAIGERTRVLLVSVAPDEDLEIYWQQHHRREGFARALSSLGIIGMTVPNFSFFNDAPRTHTLWNRARMIRVAEALSEAGVPIVLHLNASTAFDWAFWTDLLRCNPGMAYVAKEFQTGNRSPGAGEAALDAVRELQQRIGRTLHPIAIGGAQFVPHLQREFGRFTVVDSQPFMSTMFRRRLNLLCDGTREWKPITTATDEALDDLLTYNVRRYGESLAADAAEALHGNRNQLWLPLAR